MQPFFVILPLLAAVSALSLAIQSRLVFPFPPFDQLVYDTGRDFADKTSLEKPLGAEGGFRDLMGPLWGLRRLTADAAWISVLQYYGSREAFHGDDDGHDHPRDYAGGRYPFLKKLTLRVVRLDPSLHYAYLYGAGALAFNLNRPEEAMEILEEGIRRNPTYWKFRLYVGAIVYKQEGRFDHMINLLEEAIRYPDCPTMVKSILANIYDDRGFPEKALALWLEIYEGKDDSYRETAQNRIEKLKLKLRR